MVSTVGADGSFDAAALGRREVLLWCAAIAQGFHAEQDSTFNIWDGGRYNSALIALRMKSDQDINNDDVEMPKFSGN